MSNSTTLLDTLSSTQANKEAVANALFDAMSPASLWGRRSSTTTGLTWGYYGGVFNVGGTLNAIANGTVTLTANATNYVYANASTGAVSVNTTGFPAGAIALYTIVTGATTVTSYTDQRSYQPSATAGGTGTVTSVGASGGVETDQTSGAAITSSGNVRTTLKLMNAAVQTAAYTMATGDRGGCLVMNSASAVSQPLPTPATGTFPSGWWGECQNIGAGTMTLGVPTGLTLDGVTNGTLALATGTGVKFFTDGTGWYTVRGAATGGGGGSSTLAGLSDVNVTEGSGIDQYSLVWDNSTSKWIAKNVAGSGNGTAPALFISYVPGTLAASAPLLKAITPLPITLPASLTGSYAKCDTAPTAAVTCPITQNGTSIGSVNFAAGATTGTFTFSAAVTTAAGDVLAVAGPSSVDATFAGPSIALNGTVQASFGTTTVATAAHTFVAADNVGLVVTNSTSNVTHTLPTPTGSTGNFANGWRSSVSNINTGITTVGVPSGLYLDGVLNGTATILQNQGVTFYTDGTNWFTQKGLGNPSLAFLGASVPAQATTLVATTATAMNWGTTPNFDTNGFYSSASPTRLTIPSGLNIKKVRLSCNFFFTSGMTASATFSAWIRKNGTTIMGAGTQVNVGAYNNPYASITSDPIAVNDGDYFEVLYYCSAAGAVVTAATTTFSAQVVDGPIGSVVGTLAGAADASISSPADGQALRYNGSTNKWSNVTRCRVSATTTATTSIPASASSAAAINSGWSTIRDDSGGAWVSSTGTFTAPRTGWYMVTAQFQLASGAYVAGDYVTASYTVAGSAGPTGAQGRMAAAVTSFMSTPVLSQAVYLTAGQALQFTVLQSNSAAKALSGVAANNYMSIAEM